MSAPSAAGTRWVSDDNAALLTDLYQLTMLQAYFAEGMRGEAVFDLIVRRLPKSRNYLIACGLDDVLHYLSRLAFDDASIAHLESLRLFSRDFLQDLSRLRFTGEVHAVPEGTVVFAGEPLLEIVAPLAEAQLVESFVLNQIHLATLAASKASRVVSAAAGRPVSDFGLRRMQGADAALKAARAFAIAGVASTSNVLAGQLYGLPTVGTMAHSYVLAHDDEPAAFRAFARSFPEGALLVDTYDTLAGVRNVVRLAREIGDAFRVRAIRLDSGDLAALSRAARDLLDDAGLERVQILATSGLDEYAIADLIARGAPFDGFGVGTHMAVSEDAPHLDVVYKLAAYGGRGCVKLAPGKETWPGQKQVFRESRDGELVRDVVARHDAALPGRPLLVPAMSGGERLPAGRRSLAEARALARQEVGALPERLRAIDRADPSYPVEVDRALEEERGRLREEALGVPAVRGP